MLKNNVEVDVKVKCIEGGITQAKLAEDIGTSAPYVSRFIKNNEKSLKYERSTAFKLYQGLVGHIT